MKPIKLSVLLLLVMIGMVYFTSCGGEDPMPMAKAPIFTMSENFTITATCPNNYKAFINGVGETLPYTVAQTNQPQTIVVSGYGFGENLQNSETVEQTFVIPALSAKQEYVDLGLPSRTLWATQNVGANSPEDYGDYFAWGETVPKDNYDWKNYRWCTISYEGLTKYNTVPHYGGENGFVDNKVELDLDDDAAYVHYQDGRMPSDEQFKELCDKCSWKWSQLNGVNGQLVTGPNGNSIFLPAAGLRSGSSLDLVNIGYYWSRTLNIYGPYSANHLYFDSLSELNGSSIGSNHRSYGKTIRAVRISQD